MLLYHLSVMIDCTQFFFYIINRGLLKQMLKKISRLSNRWPLLRPCSWVELK